MPTGAGAQAARSKSGNQKSPGILGLFVVFKNELYVSVETIQRLQSEIISQFKIRIWLLLENILQKTVR